MKRKIYDKLVEWKNSSRGKTALLIDGARRVGKSWIAEEFAKREYASYVIVDFSKAGPKLKRIFNLYLDDLDTFFLHFEQLTGAKLVKNDALVIFDEVQKFPRAREAIKHLVKDGRYHYIETGSLISINKNVKNIVIPSEERHINMFPMDFEEFLWALGDESTMPLVRNCFEKRIPMGDHEHLLTMNRFREYMVVGGMPQAVETYLDGRNLAEVDRVKRDILSLYQADMYKFAGALKTKVRMVFNEIPAALSRHEKRIVLADIRKGAKMRDFDTTFEWLDASRIVNVCAKACEPNVGLDFTADRAAIKCYLGDTGLLVSLAFSENELARENIHTRLLTDDIELNEGMIMENVVAQMLKAAGHKLFFYSRSETDGAGERLEIDFLVSRSKTERNHNISPIEVKSSKHYTTSSLTKYREKYERFLNTAYILHTKDVRVDKDGVVRLPVYMAPLLVSMK